MIRRIKYLDFGIFKAFKWDGKLQDFREKNILYGWNYSGKTTLSRFFSFLDNKEQIKKQNLDFKLEYGDSRKEYTKENIEDLNISIKVFNSDFITQNLKWDSNEEIDAIAFDIGENVTLRKAIEDNNTKIKLIIGDDKKSGRIGNFQNDVEKFEEFENTKISKESKRIKNEIFNSLIEFSKRHFDNIKSQLGSDYEKFIIKDTIRLTQLQKAATATINKNSLPEIKIYIDYYKIRKEVIEILKSEPQESEVIQELESDSNIYNWSKEGLDYHSPDANDTCLFCGNNIKLERFEKLRKYFSNESATLRTRISNCRTSIEEEITSIRNITLPKSENDFSEGYIEEAKLLLELFPYLVKEYIKIYDILKAELNRKELENIHNKITIKDIDNTAIIDLYIWKKELHKLIAAHNTIVENFDHELDEARTAVKNHYVALYLKNEKYYSLKTKHDFAIRCIARYNCLKDKLKGKNDSLESQLKSVSAGKEELNKYIKAFLSNDSICIEVTEDDKFLLSRDKKYANNLSEGEKTAIAFAYFLVHLESLFRENKLLEYIIFIDDPISSLDANHIAQVYSLINSFFFRKSIEEGKPDKTINCFKQLFISTHNFEFFSFLKDSSQINKRKKEAGKNEPSCEYYQLKRTLNNESKILPLPKSIKSYKSEYVYLFDLIFKYYKDGCQEDDENLLLMPNAIRRFLEIFSLMKMPHASDDLETRINDLLGESHNFKLLHHFSHFTSFEKLTHFDDLIMNLPLAVDELIQLLTKTDNKHFESLKKAIKINTD